MIKLTVKRTGEIFSIAGSEYLVTFPDGTTRKIWSPPWNDYDPEEEDANALLYAAQQYADYMRIKVEKAEFEREKE